VASSWEKGERPVLQTVVLGSLLSIPCDIAGAIALPRSAVAGCLTALDSSEIHTSKQRCAASGAIFGSELCKRLHCQEPRVGSADEKLLSATSSE